MKHEIKMANNEVFWFEIIDSTHCRLCCFSSDGYSLGLTEEKFSTSIALHFGQLSIDKLEVLKKHGFIEDCFFREKLVLKPWAKFQVTKLHLDGPLAGIETIEYTDVSFELDKVYTAINEVSYKITKITKQI